MTSEPWVHEPPPERAGAVVEPRCHCGFPLGQERRCPFHGAECAHMRTVVKRDPPVRGEAKYPAVMVEQCLDCESVLTVNFLKGPAA